MNLSSHCYWNHSPHISYLIPKKKVVSLGSNTHIYMIIHCKIMFFNPLFYYFHKFQPFNILSNIKVHFKTHDLSYLRKVVHHAQPSSITKSFIQSIDREGNITNTYNQWIARKEILLIIYTSCCSSNLFILGFVMLEVSFSSFDIEQFFNLFSVNRKSLQILLWKLRIKD